MTAVSLLPGVVEVWLVLLGLVVMLGASWMAWTRLQTSRWLLAPLVALGMVPAAVAMWIGAVPSLHAGLVGTGLLIAATALSVRERLSLSDQLSALVIGAGFLGLEAAAALRTRGLLLIAPLAPVGAAILLTLFQVAHHQPSDTVQSAKLSAWTVAAGAWLAMTVVGILGPNGAGLADPAGVASLGAYPSVLAAISGTIALMWIALPGLLKADLYPYQWIRCPGYGGMQEVAVSTWSGFVSGYSARCEERVSDCTLWPTRKGCDHACIRPCENAIKD